MKINNKKEDKFTWRQIVKFEWFKRQYFLYIFGFIVNFRPSNPFLYEFLKQSIDTNDIEKQQVENLVSIFFYSTTVQTFFVFILTDFLSYTPLIIISALSGIIASSLSIWHPSFIYLQVAEVFYGTISATEIAYCVSVYANAEVKNYQRLTSYVRAAPLFAKMVSSFVAQFFIGLEILKHKELYYFNLAAFIVAAVLTIFLPPIEENVYHDHDLEVGKNKKTFLNKISLLGSNFVSSFPDKYSIKLSIWTALTICGYYQVYIHVQPLWDDMRISSSDRDTWLQNGTIEGIANAISYLATMLGGVAVFDWKYKGDLLLTSASVMQAFMLILMSQLQSPFFKCLFYFIFGCFFNFFITVVSGEIAKKLKKGSFGLTFGFLYLVGTALTCVFTLVTSKVTSKVTSVSEHINLEFMAYGYYHLAIGVLYIAIGMSYWFAKHTYR